MHEGGTKTDKIAHLKNTKYPTVYKTIRNQNSISDRDGKTKPRYTKKIGISSKDERGIYRKVWKNSSVTPAELKDLLTKGVSRDFIRTSIKEMNLSSHVETRKFEPNKRRLKPGLNGV